MTETLSVLEKVRLDVVLPKINGPEAYARMIAERPDVPMIFATGYSPDMALLHKVQGLGLTMLPKPYVPRDSRPGILLKSIARGL